MAKTRGARIARYLDDHFVAILLVSAACIVGTMIVVEVATTRPQRFTGFGLLNQDGQAGPFPASVPHNGTLLVRTSVANHEGTPRLYRVAVLVGDASTVVDPVTGSTGALPVLERGAIVDDGKAWEGSIEVRFNATLVGLKKVIFELWAYDTTARAFTFTGQTLHAWINVLAP